MSVILIKSLGNDTPIQIAKDYKSAVDYLLNNNWISDATEVAVTTHNGDFLYWGELKDVFGEGWFDMMRDNWDIDNFNDYWAGHVTLKEVNLYGEER